MSTCEARLKKRVEIKEGTFAFHIEKPNGFTFKPGQAIDVILNDLLTADDQSARHTFSIVSAPFQDELVVATRMRDSAFKRALKSLSIGASVKIDGPFGSLTLHNDRARPAVFIAGGIGITPFMSILRQATQDQRALHMTLIYANRRPEDAAFLDELQKMAQQNKNFHLVATMSEVNKSGRHWDGEVGLIDQDLIRRVVGDAVAPIYYVVGPPGMVTAMRQTLSHIDVNDDDIRSEEFYGY